MKVRIDYRFCGPPDSGNGGYVGGMVAGALGGTEVEVMLRAPPPLGVELELEVVGETARLLSGNEEIATAMRAPVAIEMPRPPTLVEAEEGESRYAGHHQHLFPGCFVCGPDRGPGDGLRIFAGPTGSSGQVATIWVPAADLGDEAGAVKTEYLWSALDCPGYWAVREAAGLALLGRIGAVVHRRPAVGELLVVSGWPVERDGRKHHVGTAIHDEEGQLVAAARATWISLKA